MTRHPFFDTPAPRVFAHRGLSDPDGEYAENSVAAVVAALSAGARYIESDCHLTADGHVVLFHDDSVERITGDPRLVADLTRDELETLMVEHGGLLTLAEALDGFPDARWNLDVKAMPAAQPVGRAVAEHGERVLLTSFSDARRRAALDAAADAAPPRAVRPATSPGRSVMLRLLLAVLVGSRRWAGRVLRGVDALQIPIRQGPLPVLSGRLVRFAHSAGVEVHVWTVNDPETMRRLVREGVDGIVTDRADVAVEVLGERL